MRHATTDEPFAALAFKIATHPFFGKLTYIRVYSGTVESGSQVINATKGLAMTAIDLLGSPETLAEAKRTFAQDMGRPAD